MPDQPLIKMTGYPTGAAPGPRGGEIPRALYALARRPLDAMTSLGRTYGDVVEVPLTPRHHFYLLGRPEHAEHVLTASRDDYAKAFTYRLLRVVLGNGLITSEGEAWAQHRRRAQPVFTHRRMEGFAPGMVEAVQHLLAEWDRLPDGSVIDMVNAMSGLMLDIVGRTLLGADLTADAGVLAPAVTTLQHAAVVAGHNPLAWMAPRLGVRMAPGYRRYMTALRTIDGILGRVIAARRSGHHGPTTSAPLLDALLQAGNDGAMNDQDIRDEIMTFFMAGHETTANAMCWTFALLSAYPGTRERLESEIDQVLDGHPPGIESVQQLPWTRAVFCESIRLYPPVWVIDRDALHDDEIVGTAVRRGSTLAISPYLIHRHPGIWDNPEGFSPDRFFEDHGHVRHRFAFLPFGGGRRGCIGSAFGMLEATISLALVAQRYRIDLLPGMRPVPEATVTLRPRGGLLMRLRRRAT